MASCLACLLLTSGLAAQDARGPSAGTTAGGQSSIRYHLERIDVTGNTATRSSVIRHFVPLERGEQLDVDDPAIELIRWRLMGTGWFSDVHLSLKKGSRRGWIVLVIDVEERNTLVIQRVIAGLAKRVDDGGKSDGLAPYAGIGVADTNLFGAGLGAAATAVVSKRQFGVDLRYSDPRFVGSRFNLNLGAAYNHARDFFGRRTEQPSEAVSIVCPAMASAAGECDPAILNKAAVVLYDRWSFSLGTAREIGGATRYTLDWQLDVVDVDDKPDAATTRRGAAPEEEVVPIQFRIEDHISFVSTIRVGLIYDRRDNPGMPSRGTLINFRAIAGTGLIGSDYDFMRTELSGRRWFQLPWGHTFGMGGFGGVVFGDAPFFYHFYASDLSDLIPSRALEQNFDHRPGLNIFGTAIREMRSEELAARVDIEYKLPLHRGGSGVYAMDVYTRVGVYSLLRREDVRVAIPGYDGLARVPVDLTFDFGVQADTSVGLFQFGFSSLIALIPGF